MSYKRQIQVKSNYEHDFVQIQGPSNYEEIDALFNKYCREVSGARNNETWNINTNIKRNHSPTFSGTKLTTALRPSTAKNGSLDSDRTINKYLTNASLTNLQMTQRSETQIKPDRKDQAKGNTHKEVRISHVQISTPENEIAQMAKDFDIPPAALASLSTPKEKEQFVIEYIRKAVSDELKELTKRHSMKMYQSKKFEKDLQHMKDKAERDKADIFKWLHVPTELDSLKKKLRAQIVNAINENTNHEVIGKALDEISRSKDNMNLTSSEKITLENIPVVNNLELLGGVLEDDQSRVFKSTRSVKHSLNKGNKSSANSFLISNRGLTSPVLKTEPNRDKCLTEREKDDEGNKTENHYEWNENKERIFWSHRADAKGRLFQQVKSSNWNDLGFSPLIQAYITNEKSKSERDTILKRYIDGDLLTAEEYKYIATTSTALNSHVDKKYLQKVVNNLDPETINALELNLAEAILKEYKRVRKEINDARQEHLQEDNKKLIENVQRKEEIFQKKIVLQANRAHQKKIKERIVGYLDKMEEKKKWKRPLSQKRNLELQSEASMMRSFTSGSERFSKEENQTKITPTNQADFLRAFVRTPNPPKAFNLKLSQHYYHPSSKLYLTSDPQQKDFMGLATTFTDQKIRASVENPEDFKLHIHSHSLLKDKSNFKRYYSGGPREQEHLIFQGNFIYGDVSDYKINNYQIPVLIKIQAVWRGFSQRKKYKKLLEEYREAILRHARERDDSIRILSRALSQSKEIKVLSPRAQGQILVQESFANKFSLSIKNEENSPARSSTLMDFDKRPISARYSQKTGVPTFKQSFFQKTERENYEEKTKGKERYSSLRIGKPRPLTAKGERLVTIETGPTQETDGSVINHRNEVLTTKSSSYKPSQKFGGDISKRVLTEGEGLQMDTRIVTISKRAPPKGLLLKQRKLFIAAKSNNMSLITASGFHYFETDANAKDDYNNTPLYYAARNGNKEICEFLLGCGARVNESCQEGNTPLHMAFSSNEVMVTILLISKGGNLNTLNDHGQTPLAFGSESLLNLLNLRSGVATYEHSGNRSLPSGFDNNHLLSKSEANGKSPYDSIMFRYQPLEKTSAKVLDRDNNLHTFMSQEERNAQKLK